MLFAAYLLWGPACAPRPRSADDLRPGLALAPEARLPGYGLLVGGGEVIVPLADPLGDAVGDAPFCTEMVTWNPFGSSVFGEGLCA